MTMNEFPKSIEGVWIDADSVQELYEGEYSYAFFDFSVDAVYAGAMFAGTTEYKPLSYQQLSENKHSLKLARVPIGDDISPSDYEITTFTITLNSKELLTLVDDEDGYTSKLIYGGKTTDEADATLRK